MAKTKILVVDDSSVIRQQVSLLLNHSDYEVIQASDGVDGERTVDSNPDIQMVISDVNMPRMNGLEMLEKIKAKHPSLAVMMLTTEGSPDLMRRAKAAGAIGWLVKPFKSEHLLAVVEKVCKKAA